MREMDPEFELFDIAQVRAGDRIVRDTTGTEIARPGKTQGTVREYKKSGNEAKKWLKTKHITFLKWEIATPFACKFAQIGR
jgi:hypothetical protein